MHTGQHYDYNMSESFFRDLKLPEPNFHLEGRMALEPRRYAVVTLHRPANVDNPDSLGSLISQLLGASSSLPMVFAVHPRTRKRLQEFGLMPRLQNCGSLRSRSHWVILNS